MSKKILVLDCFRHTLTVVRSLSRAGYNVILGVTADQVEREFVHVSRYVSSIWPHPDKTRDVENFDRALLDLLSSDPEIEAVFPVGETSLRNLARIRSELPPDVLLVMPENDAIDACLDKPTANHIAEHCQIPVPRYRLAHSSEELRAAIEELGLPAIAKASDSRTLLLNRKCVFIRTQVELEKVVAHWPDGGLAYIVQDEIRGPRINCDVVAENGEIRLYFESEIIRTDQPDYSGNSVLDRSVPPDPRHKQYCERLVAYLDYTGVALIQFLKDARTGQSLFLEANPRAGANIALSVHCGIDLPAGAVGACTGNLSVTNVDYPYNKLRNCFTEDLLGIRRALKRREIGLAKALAWLASACSDGVRANCHATFSWTDPKPALRMIRGLAIRSLSSG